MSSASAKAIPRFETPIIETHCHLDYLEEPALDNVLSRATQAGIERIVTIAVSPDNLQRVLAIADTYPQVWCTQGIHPHEASQWNPQVSAHIREGCTHGRVVAIGEIGLDYFYEHSDRAAQARAFEAQLQLAAELDLPVVIHTRDADSDTRAILENHCRSLRRRGVIHSFTSSLALAEFCLQEGFMLGFNGITTFRNADNVRAVVAATPRERLVLETDAPYLTPTPFRGKPNEPQYLPLIAEKVAEVLGMDTEALLQQAYSNSQTLFFTP